jgi:hypothetical protein
MKQINIKEKEYFYLKNVHYVILKQKNHWNLKMHHAAKHTTLEERKKYKYYCDTCDIVFFCEAYFIKHSNGIHHKNMIKALKYQSEINKMVEEKK